MRRRGLTLAELVLTVVLLAIVFSVLAAAIVRRMGVQREEARRIRCRGNLNQVAKAMATYLYEHGDHRFFPFPIAQGTRPGDFNGAEWIATLYWSAVMPDPGVYICPSSPDSNANGADIGTFRAPPTFGSRTLSYAGMHYRSGTLLWLDPSGAGALPRGHKLAGTWVSSKWNVYVLTDVSGAIAPAAVRDDFPPNLPMASDDTQGPVHHRGGMAVLFFDSHVEFRLAAELGPRDSVGRSGGLLWQLRN